MVAVTRQSAAPPTRIIAMGSAALAEGFGLIGVETYVNATPEMLESLLAELVNRREKALLYIEHDLARSGGPWLARVRDRGGRIVVVEIPRLNAPRAYHPLVEDLVRSVLGPGALEETR